MKFVVSIIIAVEVDAPNEDAIFQMGPTIDNLLQTALDNGEWEIIENGIELAEDD